MKAISCVEFLAIFCQSVRDDTLLDSDFLTVGAVRGQSKAMDNFFFDVLLTVNCSNDQFWFQLMHHNFTLLTKSLYMFRALMCPSSGG